MFRSLAAVLFAALVVAPGALAAYPGTYAQQGSDGVLDPDLSSRYVASNSGGDTLVQVFSTRDGTRMRSQTLSGQFGVPTLIPSNIGLGMFHDGSAFVLQSIANQASTSFAVLRTSDLSVGQMITLPGSFAFDALSPDGTRLYLIEHKSSDYQHYIVRAYDLAAQQLLPGRIADKAQKSWVMQGFPTSRVETPSGRWVYTLYSNPGGFPFVHALDTVNGVAHCVGLGWKGSQDPLFNYQLKLKGNKLLVLRNDATVYRVIDRTTWAVHKR
jgi:DNA-binding beta-propeller fold protein YncE